MRKVADYSRTKVRITFYTSEKAENLAVAIESSPAYFLPSMDVESAEIVETRTIRLTSKPEKIYGADEK